MKKYYGEFYLRFDYEQLAAFGIVEFEAKSPRHANRKLRAGLNGMLKEKLSKEYSDAKIEFVERAYKTLDEIPKVNLKNLGLVSLVESYSV